MHKNLRRSFYLLTIIAILFTSLGSNFTEVKAASTIFINEIHYDNTGDDAGEGVEIAGPAGTDLSGWYLYPYNGSNGEYYSDTALSGTIPDQNNGYGTLSFPIAGLQNGIPDGIALVDDTNNVVQFLSYEGSFTATDGPANGMNGTDIGVSESSSTVVGDSLQMTGGPATDDSGFTWTSGTASFGSVNTGQSFTPPPPPPIIINELDADQSSTDAAEFIELYDGGVGNTALDGYVLVLYNGGGTDASYAAFDLDGQSTDANGYFVICGDNANVANCDLDVSPNTDLIQNGEDAAALYMGDDTDFPNGTAVTTTNLLDAIVYDTNDSDDPELLALLNASEPQVNEGGGGDSTVHSNQRCPNGTGGERNTSTYAQVNPTPGTENLCAPPVATHMIINEVDSDTVGIDTLEFVELYDGGTGNTALDGLVVVFYNGNGDTSYAAYDLDTHSTSANGYFILGNTAVTGVDIFFSSNGLQNGADAVALYAGDAADFPNGTAVTTTNLLDAIVYDTSDGDDAALLALLTAGGQVDEDFNDKDTESSQRCPNGSGSQRDTSSYAQHPPTADAANTCGVTPPSLVINEVNADPDTTNGDANGDGTAHYEQDEFVEIVNNGASDLDVSGWTLNDAVGIRHTFPAGSVIPAGCNIVVFGGGSPTGTFGGAAVQIASSGLLGLNNGGDTVTLKDGTNDIVSHTYGSEGGNNQSLTRDPDITGSDPLVAHSTATGSGAALYSPGTMINGTSFSGCSAAAAIDLELTKIVDDNNPDEGDTIIFTLTVSNVSTTQAATNVVVRDYLPNFPGQINSANIGPCSQGSVASLPSNDVEWTVGDLATGASATCTIQAVVSTGTDGTSFDNNAEVYSVTETTDQDSTPGNYPSAPVEDDEASVTVSVGVPAACGTSGTTLISAIQGTGTATPMDGSTVTIEGVVVGDFQTGSNLSGFFVQEEDADADANPASSEGIFVYDGGTPAVDVNVGDVVRVSGTVDEYFDLTEITSVTQVLNCGTGSAMAATITLPVATLDVWEQHEGMLVNIPQTLYATGNYYQGRYGEVDLSVGGKLDNPTNVAAPGAAAIALKELNDRSRIQMDDGSRAQNPPTAPYIGVDNTLRTGDTISGLTGVLHYYSNSSGVKEYEIHPVVPVSFSRVNARQAAPSTVGGTVKVASFNVLNYFTTLDTGASICGPSGTLDCRGANTAAEFTRQRTKIISAITAMDADVIGLMEMENHPTDDALTDLVTGLNASAGAGTYAAIGTGTIGTDAIKVALIYKPATVTPLGGFEILDSSDDANFNDTKNRPALAQTFVEIASGERFTVAVNHLKSKGSDCVSLGDPDMGDGQGNCNLTRTSAATAEVNWLATDPTGSGDPDFIIIGDLNAYALEDPITAITNGGYTNLISNFLGASATSYQFMGEHGYLDHALATASLTGQVTGVVEWHINGDEPAALDYNDYNQGYLYQPDAFRASDHDPVLVGLSLGAPPVVIFGANTVPADGASLTTGPMQILVEFSKDVLNDGSAGAANNPANYLLVEAMGDGFQTDSCVSGPHAADLSIPIDSAFYLNTAGFVTTVNINGGIPLPAGTYRFFVCGTTSITDLSGLELNGGLADTVINFTVGSASELPATGFPQGMVTPLGEQPQDMQYTETVMMLDIPSLGVSTPIVGVPINGQGWDITWLGGNAGYLAGTAFPTWNGNTVITGHVWDANNLPGPFANVKQLNYGDMIQIQAWDLTYTYQVRETTTVRPWQVNSALREETYDWVTLVTCEDFNDASQSYTTRRVIRAVLVDVR